MVDSKVMLGRRLIDLNHAVMKRDTYTYGRVSS